MKQYKLSLNSKLKLLNEAFDASQPVSDTNQPLRDDEKTMAQVAAQILQRDTENDAVKFWAWAIQLHGGGELVLDQSDFDMLRGYFKKQKGIAAVVRGQLEEEFRLSESR